MTGGRISADLASHDDRGLGNWGKPVLNRLVYSAPWNLEEVFLSRDSPEKSSFVEGVSAG